MKHNNGSKEHVRLYKSKKSWIAATVLTTALEITGVSAVSSVNADSVTSASGTSSTSSSSSIVNSSAKVSNTVALHSSSQIEGQNNSTTKATSATASSATQSSAKATSATTSSVSQSSAKATSATASSATQSSAKATSAKTSSATQSLAKATNATTSSATQSSAKATSATASLATQSSAKATSAKTSSVTQSLAKATNATTSSVSQSSAKTTSSVVEPSNFAAKTSTVKTSNISNESNQEYVTVPNRSLGFDVSDYQGNNVIGQMKNQGAKFVIVKVSEGSSNGGAINAGTKIKDAKADGMATLGYHYAHFGASSDQAAHEAVHAAANAKYYGLPEGSYLACDYEQFASGSVANNTNAVITFMGKVKQLGYNPLLYSSASYLKEHLNTDEIVNKFGPCLWVASWQPNGNKPDFKYFPSMNGVIIWQYTDKLDGNSLDGDINVLPLKTVLKTNNVTKKSNNQADFTKKAANTNNNVGPITTTKNNQHKVVKSNFDRDNKNSVINQNNQHMVTKLSSKETIKNYSGPVSSSVNQSRKSSLTEVKLASVNDNKNLVVNSGQHPALKSVEEVVAKDYNKSDVLVNHPKELDLMSAQSVNTNNESKLKDNNVTKNVNSLPTTGETNDKGMAILGAEAVSLGLALGVLDLLNRKKKY